MISKYLPVIKEIRKIALPISLQALLISSLQLVDNLFIGHLKDASYVASGVNAVNNVTFIIGTLVTGFIAGIGVYFTQISASNDTQKQQDLFRAKIIWMLILSFIFIGVVIIFLGPITSLWISNGAGADKSRQFAKDYGYIVIPSLILDFVIVVYANSYKEVKKTKVPVIIAITALVVNASLNYVLMYAFHLGIKGSAYATLAARILEIVIWGIYVWKTRPIFIPKFLTIFKVKMETFVSVFWKSLFWSINGFLLTLAFTLQIMFMSRISTDAGASLNSAGVILQLIYAFTGGFSQAMGIMVVAYLANHKLDEVRDYVKKNVVISTIFGIICGVVIIAISPMMFLLYPDYNNMQSIIMVIAVGSTIWISLVLGVITAVLKGSGFAKSLIIIDALVSWTIPMPLTIVLTQVPAIQGTLTYGEIYLIISMAIFIKVPITISFYKHNLQKIKPLKI